MNKAGELVIGIGDKVRCAVISGTTGALEYTAKGLNLLSSIVKGEKKISVKIEEVV